MDTIYLDIDSQYRNRLQFPNPYDFTINYSDEKNNETLLTSANPISDAYPIKEWSWNSLPPTQIITAGDKHTFDGRSVNGKLLGSGPRIFAYLDVSLSHRVDNRSDGTGLTFKIVTKPTTLSNKLTAGELNIVTYGSGYIEGETLKVHRSDLITFGGPVNLLQKISYALQPVLMTKGFEKISGYKDSDTFNNSTSISFTSSVNTWNCTEHGLNNGDMIYFTKAGSNNNPTTYFLYHRYYVINKTTNTFQLSLQYIFGDVSYGGPVLIGAGVDSTSDWTAKKAVEYETSGGSGTGQKIILDITKFSNDEKIIVMNGTQTSTYREGDILTVLKPGSTTGSIKVMLVDLRFRIGQSYSLDTTNIVRNNTITDSSLTTYHHANLEPLQSITKTSGKGSGMLIATIEEAVTQDTATENVLLLNQIAYIFEIGQNYRIGDTVTVTDRSGNEHVLTLVEPSNKISNKNNIEIIYDTELFDGSPYTEPELYARNTNDSMDVYGIGEVFSGTTTQRLNLNDINASGELNETLTSIKNITSNKIYFHNSRFFGLGLYDNYLKGLIFEDMTAGTQSRITKYDHKNSSITLEEDFKNEHTTIQNFWKIANPSTSSQIFVPNGSDNPKDYIGQIYEAVVYTGQINSLTDFVIEENVSFGGSNVNQLKINNKAFDKRIIHQYRTIIDYDIKSKMITLDKPLIGITSHANQFGKSSNNIVESPKYIHIAGNNFQNTLSGSAHTSLAVFPVELDTYATLDEAPTNTKASGLTVDIVITNNTIASINDITVVDNGSGSEVQGLSGTTYTDTSVTGQNYTTYS